MKNGIGVDRENRDFGDDEYFQEDYYIRKYKEYKKNYKTKNI